MAQGGNGGGSGSGTNKVSENMTKTVSESRTDTTWWTTPAGSKTPYTLLDKFR